MTPLLDSTKNKCNRPCGYLSASGETVKDGLVYRTTARVYCKKWSCPFCGPWKANKFITRVAEVAKERDLSRFLTLTLDPSKLEKNDDSMKYLRQTWRKFRVSLQRKFNTTVSFIAVMEFHKSGIPHLHVMIDRYIKQSWIKVSWSKIGGGHIVDIRKIQDLEKVGFYIGKYLAKDALSKGPKGWRRFSTSQDIKLFPKKENSGWKLMDMDIEDLYRLSKFNATGESRLFSGELRSFMVPETLDTNGEYQLNYWHKVDPDTIELPDVLKNTTLKFTPLGVGEYDEEDPAWRSKR